jgi:hypothetical protein
MDASSFRQLIDAAKEREQSSLSASLVIATPGGDVEITRTVSNAPRSFEKEEIDPSRVFVADETNRELTAVLVAQLIDIRAQKRSLDDRDGAIKKMLEDMAGELEFIALDEGDRPLISLKRESSVRIKTAAVKERFPVEENPDFYSLSSSRPLRIM